MKISGPLTLSVTDDDVQNKRTLEIRFTPEFIGLTPEQQISDMKKYIQSLFQAAQTLQSDSRDRAGIELVMQISEQLLPHIQQQEIDYDETILLDMALNESPEVSVSLRDLGLN